MVIQNVRGTSDILPDNSYITAWIENKSKEVFKKAAEILETIKESLSHLAYYQYYSIESYFKS